MARQLGLFPGDGDGVGAAPAPPALRALAARLPETLRLGTSSWSFPGWRGLVYDRAAPAGTLAREGLAAYARHPLLRTVGVDRGFYAPLARETWAAYAAQVPEGFRFLAKAPEACTAERLRGSGAPNPRAFDPAWAAERVVAPFVEGLGARAGPLVFQVPPPARGAAPEAARFAERLHGFLAALPRGPLYAVEIRHRAWLGRAYADALADAGALHCFAVHPRMPRLAEQVHAVARAAGRAWVARWSLGHGLAYEAARARYAPFDRLVAEDPPTRAEVAAGAVAALRAGDAVFVAINNKAEGCAPRSVARLAEAVAAGLSAPARGSSAAPAAAPSAPRAGSGPIR